MLSSKCVWWHRYGTCSEMPVWWLNVFNNPVTGPVSQEYEWNPAKCHTAHSCLRSSETADMRGLQSTVSYKSDYDVTVTSSLLPNGWSIISLSLSRSLFLGQTVEGSPWQYFDPREIGAMGFGSWPSDVVGHIMFWWSKTKGLYSSNDQYNTVELFWNLTSPTQGHSGIWPANTESLWTLTSITQSHYRL